MTHVLVAYEDHYFRALDQLLRRACRANSPDLKVQRDATSVEGVSNFPGFVKRTWPRYLKNGFPRGGKGKPQVLICVADADKINEQLGLSTPKRAPYGRWVVQAEEAFTAKLREGAKDPARIHGCLLRWSLESLLIAGFDHHPAMQALAGREPLKQDALKQFLATCTPPPIQATSFTDTYQRPQACLKDMASTLKWAKLKKGDTRKDAALDALGAYLPKLMHRAPDLSRACDTLATAIQGLKPSSEG